MQREELYERLRSAYFSEHPHEEDVLRHLPRLLSGMRRFVDVGASLGQYTRLAAWCLESPKIWAIEADPLRFEQLLLNCAEWERATGAVIVARHAAASDCTGETEFAVSGSNVSGGLFRHDVAAAEPVTWTRVRVPCVRLDTLFGEDPDFIKIDVEGAELRVLRGAEAILKRGHADFQIEVHPWGDPETGARPRSVIAWMLKNRYLPAPFFGQWYFTRSFRRWMLAAGIRLSGALLHSSRRLLRRR
ncbi:MAG: FkbM family methyltransferase [Candidatus Schekmanbacteria bacterium]|nr:FkbM family methyltransferase [Candidatus Schekmanbacteria bacterium]